MLNMTSITNQITIKKTIRRCCSSMKQRGLFLIIGFLLTQTDISVAELRLAIDTPTIITGGTDVRYTIQYENSGSSILPHVWIQTALLSSINYSSWSQQPTSLAIDLSGNTQLSRNMGTLYPWQTGTLIITGYNSWSRISGTILPIIITGFSNTSEGLFFDGINDYISIPYIPNIDFYHTSGFTFSTRISLKTNNYASVLNNRVGYGLNIAHDNLGLEIQLAHQVPSNRILLYTPTIPLESLYNLTVTYNWNTYASWIEVYYNNIIQQKTTSSNNLTNSIQTNQGYKINSAIWLYWNNIIYDFKIFNKALDSWEVAELYNTSGSIIPTTASWNIILDYRFHDRLGSWLKDYSPNNLTGGSLINFSNLTLWPLNSRVDRRWLAYSGDNTQDNYLATTSWLSIYQTHSDLWIILSWITSSYRGWSQISFDLIYNNSWRDSTTWVIVLSRSTWISFWSSSMTGVLAWDTITYTWLFLTKNQTGSIQIALNSLLIWSWSSNEWLSTSIIWSDQDLHTTNNYTTQYTTIKKTDLIISQQVTGLYLSGWNIYYTLHYYNNSPQDLSNITITNQLSEHITLVNTTPSYTTYAANTITRSWINLSAYTTGTITITGIIISWTIGTSILNIASITDTIHGDINNSNNISSSLTSLGNGPSDTRIQLENNTSLLLSWTSAWAWFQYGYANTLVANQEFWLSMLMWVGTTAIPWGYQYYFFTNSASGPTFIIANYGDSGLTTNNTLQVFLFWRWWRFSTSYQFPPQWTNVHIIITFKNDILKLYINWVFHSQYYKPWSFAQQWNAWWWYNNINGSYKSIKFFGSGLTDQQVSELYVSQNKKNIGSELSYWNFDTISWNNIQDSIWSNTTTINPSLVSLTRRSTWDIQLPITTSGWNNLSYPLYIWNYGPYRATWVTISTTLASWLSYTSHSLTWFSGAFSSQTIWSSTVLYRSGIDLAPYQSGFIIVTGFVDSWTDLSENKRLVKVSWDITSTSSDTYLFNNTTSYQRIYNRYSDLRISVDQSAEIAVGTNAVYTISYGNSWRDDSTWNIITLSRQTWLQFVSSSLPGWLSGNNQYQRTGLSLQKNQTWLITLTLLALTWGAGSQSIWWTWSIIWQNLDPDYSDTIITWSTEIIVPADLRIIKSVNTWIIYQWDTIIYTIDYGNSGHQTAKGVLISDNVLSGIQISNTSITPARSGSNHFERDITTLSPWQTGRIIITGSIIWSRTDWTQITNTALIRQDGGLRFDGIDDYISLPSSISQLLQDTVQYNKNFSFSFWIYITPNYNNSNGQGGIFFGNNNANYNGLDTRWVNIWSFGQNYISFYIVNMNNPWSIGWRYSIPLGLWLHQFSFVHISNSHLDIYANGTLVATTPTTLNTTINYLTDISPRLWFYPFAGTNYRQKWNIYDFKIFNKSLTSWEVRNLYMTQWSIIPSSAVESILADWRFNDMYGQLLSDRWTNNLTWVLTNYTIADTTLWSTNKRVDSTLNPLITPFSEEQNSANNASTVETTFFIRPDLWISGNAILSAYALNDTISYQILYGNSGGTTTWVTTPTFTITSTIASGIQYISALPAPTTQTINSIGETILTRSWLIMTWWWSGSIILTGQVIQSFAPVSNNILHLLSISTGRWEIITGNNTRSIATIYTPTADIAIALSPTIISGLLDTQIIQHLISWINLWPDVSWPLSLTLNRWSGYVYITGSQIWTIYATWWSWVLPSIGSGQTWSITITGMIATWINPTITPTIPLSWSILPTIQDRQLDNNIISWTLILAPSLRNIVNRYQNRGSSSQQEWWKIAIYSWLQLITGISFQQNEGWLTILSGELFNNLSWLFTVIVEWESSLIVAKQQLSIQPWNIMIDFRTGSTLWWVFTNTVQWNLTKKWDLVKWISVAEWRNYINSLDLQVLLNHIGNPSLAYNSQYDLNNDGWINAADVSILIGNFYQQWYWRPYDYNF